MGISTTPARTASGRWFQRVPCCIIILLLPLTGCGTTRSSDTARTATEQLLISHAIDEAISQLDCSLLRDKKVFLDAQFLDGTVDKGYLISTLRQHLLAAGCLLQEERARATYVVEARSGAIGTDRHALLVGVPAMTLPTVLPGQPSSIPEIPFIKKSDAHGVAKVALFAYNRVTGERLWQSGMLEAQSEAKDSWIVGLGPFRAGNLVPSTQLAGEQLAFPLISSESDIDRNNNAWYALPVTSGAAWQETRLPPPKWSPLMETLARAISGELGNGPPVATDKAQITGGAATPAPASTSSSPTSDTLQAPINLPEMNLQQVLHLKTPPSGTGQ
jgi:hypothetical protein